MLRPIISCAVLALAVTARAPGQSTPAEAQGTKPEAPRPAGIWYGLEKARPKAPGALRLASYNVENLFDRKDDPANPYDQDEMTKPERLEAIAAATGGLAVGPDSIDRLPLPVATRVVAERRVEPFLAPWAWTALAAAALGAHWVARRRTGLA